MIEFIVSLLACTFQFKILKPGFEGESEAILIALQQLASHSKPFQKRGVLSFTLPLPSRLF